MPTIDVEDLVTRRRAQLAGVLLIVGGVGFWAAWALMPLAGTRDPGFILAAVARARTAVWVSCVVQLGAAAAWAAGLVLVPGPAEMRGAGERRGGRGAVAWWAGAAMLVVGMCGSAADAIYHLVAYELTAPSVAAEVAGPVMARFQGPDLALLAPAVAAWAAGVVVFAVAGVRLGLVPRAVLASFAVAAAGVAAAALGPAMVRRSAGMVVLAGAVAPSVSIGWAVVRRAPVLRRSA